MQQIILLSNILEIATIGHSWLYGRKWPSRPPPLPKRKLGPQYRRSPRILKFSQPLATRYEKKVLAPTKNIFVVGGSICHRK